MSIIILVKSENGKLEEILLNCKLILGRSSKADLVINDAKISGRHCSIEPTKDGKVLFKDLDSTNGSYLGNLKVETHYFSLYEEIRIGNTLLKIDEKRLSPTERLSIGKSNINHLNYREQISLPPVQETNEKKTNSIVKPRQKPIRKVVVSNKEKMLEQEESSGTTKLLKLDSKKNKK